MKETFVILGWLFAIFLLLFVSLNFMSFNVSGFFPFQKRPLTIGKCESSYTEITEFVDCKSSCLDRFKVKSYKIENDKCFCDLNNC